MNVSVEGLWRLYHETDPGFVIFLNEVLEGRLHDMARRGARPA